MPVYDKNLLALEGKNPLLAFQLLTLKNPASPKKREPFPKSTAEILYVEGIGDEKWIEKALDWITSDAKRSLVLIEENLSAFHPFLSQALAEKIVQHPRVVIGGPSFEETLKPFVWSHLYRPWECHGNPAMQGRIAELVLGIELTVCLYRDFGIPQLMNVFSNLLASQNVRSGEALFGKFTKIPALICGAGPSLDKSLDTLKALGNQALLFGGGSALLPLSRAGVPMHFAVALDPESPRERFFEQTYFDVPLFYQNQVSHPLFMQSQGPKLCIGESGSFPLEEWLDLPLSPCDVGWNVATFATQIAYQLGCDPILFVGMDLCCSPEKAYAGGMEELRENPLVCTDRLGNRVTTRPDFLMAKKWLETFAKAHPERTFLNASEGGLELEGIKNVPLSMEAPSTDLQGRVHQAIAQVPLLDLSTLPSKLHTIYQSLNHCLDILGTYQEVELDHEIFYQAHLLPNWEVWKHFLQKEEIVQSMQHPEIEKKLQQTLFFREVTENFRNEYERKLPV